MAKRLIFARHGESEVNVRGLVNGDPRVSWPLTERGRRQAEELGEDLAGEAVEICITTEFGRTQETAAIAFGRRGVLLEIDPGLNDPPLGVFESRSADEYLRWLGDHDWSAAPDGGGESQLDSLRRYLDAFERLVGRPEQTVVVIGHAFPTGVARTLASGEPPAVRPHYACDLDFARPIEIEAAALEIGIARARDEFAGIDARRKGDLL